MKNISLTGSKVFSLLSMSFMVLFLVLLIPGAWGITSNSASNVNVTLMSQSPDPVEPGQIVTVKFKVENAGMQTNSKALAIIHPQYPFSLYGDKAEKDIGMLLAASTGNDAVVVEYKLKVDEQATEGDTEIELEVKMGESSRSFVDNQFLIDIQTRDAILDIVSITAEPDQVIPGGTTQVSIMVKNLADSLLKDIKFKLNLNDANLLFAPYQSSSERRIASLQSGFQQSLSFQIIASPKVTPGLYKIPVNISYSDEKGTFSYISDVIALTVGETPKIRAYVKKSSVLQDNAAGKLDLEVANAGTMDVRYLEMYLLPSEDYELVSSSSYTYIGDVDSDDTGSEEFDIFVKNGVEILHVPIQLKYYDANNKPFNQQFPLELNLHSASELRKFGVLPPLNISYYLAALLLIGGGIYWYQYSRKKKSR